MKFKRGDLILVSRVMSSGIGYGVAVRKDMGRWQGEATGDRYASTGCIVDIDDGDHVMVIDSVYDTDPARQEYTAGDWYVCLFGGQLVWVSGRRAYRLDEELL